jgi:hypothetical protein
VDTIDTRSGTSTLTLGSSNAGTIALGSGDVQSNFNSPFFFVTLNSSQTISNTTETIVQFNNEVFDADNKYNTSTHKFTPTVAGKYMLSVAARMNASEDFDIFTLAIQKNGSTIARVDKRHENNESLAFSIIQEADADDYFQVSVYQNSGGNRDLLGDSAAFTFFQGFRIGS